jgi:DNA-binding MarR family transcriptional regulator
MPSKKAFPDGATAPLSPQTTQELDTSFLQSLIGYNARRAALSIIEVFLQRMAVYGLRPVDFSVLSVLAHNPGATSRQVCTALSILPPNFVALINSLEERKLVTRKPHPSDKRAIALKLTAQGVVMVRDAQITAHELETEMATHLTAKERQTLIRLLQKIYAPAANV